MARATEADRSVHGFRARRGALRVCVRGRSRHLKRNHACARSAEAELRRWRCSTEQTLYALSEASGNSFRTTATCCACSTALPNNGARIVAAMPLISISRQSPRHCPRCLVSAPTRRKAAVRKTLEEYLAERKALADAQPEAARPKPKAYHLSNQQLLAEYGRIADDDRYTANERAAAQMRIDMINLAAKRDSAAA
jgi:hypothetical protein